MSSLDNYLKLKNTGFDEVKKVFYLRWSRGSVNTWEEIADMLHVSRKSIYRKRERILTIFADFRGNEVDL